jgi:hypothetical protein
LIPGGCSGRWAFRATRKFGDGPVWSNNRYLAGEEIWLVG